MKLRKLFYILSKWILTLFSTSHNAIIGIFITYRSISTLNHSKRTTIPKTEPYFHDFSLHELLPH